MNLLDLMVRIGVDDQASPKIGGIASGITGKLGQAAKVVGTAIAGATAAAGAGAVAIGKAAVDSYASYEQLAGGVEKLYGSASDSMMRYAQDAYRTSGMSANQYMEQATSFSAALIKSLGGDVGKAADQTDKAMRLMSDNVNTFGTDAQSVQYAIQGLSRENYTMLDNLKLGYSGTREGMQQLIDDANEYARQQGINADLTMGNFSDMIDAIDLIQQKQHIWGTTAKEAATTIEGSVNMTKAAWENFLTSLGSGSEDQIRMAVGGIVSGVFGTWDDEAGKRVGGIINNVAPVVQRVGAAMLAEIPSLASTVAYSFLEWLSVSFGNGDTEWIDELFYAVDDFTQKAGKAIGDFASAFKGAFKSDEFVNAFEHIKSAAGKAFDIITENADVFGTAFGVAVDVLGAVADAVASVIDVLGPFVPAIAGAVGALALLGPISGIVSTLSGAFTFFTTVIVPAMGMVQSFGGAIALVTTLLGGPIPILLAIGGAIVAFVATNEGAREAIVNAWNAVVQFFAGIPAWWDSVWVMVVDTVKGAVNDAIAKWVELREQASQIWEGVKTMVTTKVIQLVASVVNKVNELKANAVAKFNEIKANITTAVQNARDTAINAFQRLKDGVSEKINGVLGFVRSLPSKIKSALGNLGSLLWNAGSSVIRGLLNGMKSAIGGVYSWVRGIAGRIASLKGPIPYDLKVLIPNGKALMGGLQKGLSIGFEDDVKPYVESMAGEMSNAFNVPSVSASGYATQKSGPTFNLTIGSLTVRGRDDAYYFADRINEIWKHEVEGSLA